jgi:hypothetical protein
MHYQAVIQNATLSVVTKNSFIPFIGVGSICLSLNSLNQEKR